MPKTFSRFVGSHASASAKATLSQRTGNIVFMVFGRRISLFGRTLNVTNLFGTIEGDGKTPTYDAGLQSQEPSFEDYKPRVDKVMAVVVVSSGVGNIQPVGFKLDAFAPVKYMDNAQGFNSKPHVYLLCSRENIIF